MEATAYPRGQLLRPPGGLGHDRPSATSFYQFVNETHQRIVVLLSSKKGSDIKHKKELQPGERSSMQFMFDDAAYLSAAFVSVNISMQTTFRIFAVDAKVPCGRPIVFEQQHYEAALNDLEWVAETFEIALERKATSLETSSRFDTKAIAFEFVKALAGASHTFQFSNATDYHVCMLVHEDPEGFMNQGKVMGKLGADPISHLVGGIGVKADAQNAVIRKGARPAALYSLGAGESKTVSANSCTVFVDAAFVEPGYYRVFYQDRAVPIGTEITFLPTHYSDPAAQCVSATSLHDALVRIKSDHGSDRPSTKSKSPSECTPANDVSPTRKNPSSGAGSAVREAQSQLPSHKVTLTSSDTPCSSESRGDVKPTSLSPTSSRPSWMSAKSFEIYSSSQQKYFQDAVILEVALTDGVDDGYEFPAGSLLIGFNNGLLQKRVRPDAFHNMLRQRGNASS